MEIKIKGGKTFKIRDVSLDDRDSLLDSIKYVYDDKGVISNMEMMHGTVTNWLRTCLVDNSDEAILKLKQNGDDIKIFTKLQNIVMLGEGKAS